MGEMSPWATVGEPRGVRGEIAPRLGPVGWGVSQPLPRQLRSVFEPFLWVRFAEPEGFRGG